MSATLFRDVLDTRQIYFHHDVYPRQNLVTDWRVGMSLTLALIGRHLDLPREAPVTLYGLGRSAGWLAHAIEQMQTGASPKARLRYIGVHPQA